MKPFLTAKWTNLLFLTYAVSEATLTPYLPPGLELERWEGQVFASIVAFDFRDTSIRGRNVPNLPNLRSFPELNLRFYVRQGDRRGVVFVREIVPHPLVAGLARLWYNEPYMAARLRHAVTPDGAGGRVERFELMWKGEARHLAVSVPAGPSLPPTEDGFGPWITEQPWGFGRTQRGQLTRFQVAHPAWRTYPITGYENTLDFGALYGDQWSFLRDRAADSVIFAEGSPVTVYANEPGGPVRTGK